ncbi:hypothetical protein F5Y16DRAFT_405036 [Xylariaceae sp. FL0255]|nr:hypothetical protein F5Y16DRAFT_405036 [Xylariaceae sp. FL0255]
MTRLTLTFLFTLLAFCGSAIAGEGPIPLYCEPWQPDDANNPATTWVDVSVTCETANLTCVAACVTFVPVDDCVAYVNEEILCDLNTTMTKALTNTGLGNVTIGKYYTAGWGPYTTSFAQPNTVMGAFQDAISKQYNGTSKQLVPANVYFQAGGEDFFKWYNTMLAAGNNLYCPT